MKGEKGWSTIFILARQSYLGWSPDKSGRACDRAARLVAIAAGRWGRVGEWINRWVVAMGLRGHLCGGDFGD